MFDKRTSKKKSRVIDVPTVRAWRHGPYSRVCEREAFSLELFIFHVNGKEGGCLSNGAQNVIFLSLPSHFFCFFSEQLQLSLISDVLLRMLTQKICVHLQRYVPKTVRDM